jgi:iron(III) transport system substrate-binding protein
LAYITRSIPLASVRRTAVGLVGAFLILALAGCGGDEGSEQATTGSQNDNKITIYSGRSEELVQPLFDQFSAETSTEVEVRYGNTAQLAAQLLEEGEKSPADVFFAQDAGALGAVTKAGMFAPLPSSATDLIPEQYRANNDAWVGVTARSRVLAYNPDLVAKADLPSSVYELAEPQWKGKVGVAPTNASFQAFVTAIRVQDGDDKAREFLAGLKANEPAIRDGNAPILEEINDGKIAVGLINHYYVGELAKEKGVSPDSLKAQLYFFPDGDPGALVNVAGVGVLKNAADDPDAQAFVDYLLDQKAQTYFAEQTYEYPVVKGVAGPRGVPALDELEGPKIDLNDLDSLEQTITLIKESGLTP